MAAGDYGPGTQLQPVMINITVGADGKIDHCGVGYHIVTPSGKRHDGGFTYHSPRGNHAHAPKHFVETLQGCVDQLLAEAAKAEGIEPGPGIGLAAIDLSP